VQIYLTANIILFFKRDYNDFKVRKNRNYLLVGTDAAKKSSVACFYKIEKEVLLKK
jgi:hypothetical protein